MFHYVHKNIINYKLANWQSIGNFRGELQATDVSDKAKLTSFSGGTDENTRVL